MSTDIRALMRSLAEDAPDLDNRIALADKAFSAGRHRRRVRRALVSAASAVVALLLLGTTLFVGPSPLAAQYGTSGGTKVSGYPSHIGQQWPILDLPAKPGPIAGVLTDGETTWAVSPSGHRWRIAGDNGGYMYDTTVSADGRMIAYLGGNFGPLIIRDLVSGKVTRVPNIGIDENEDTNRYWMAMEIPAYFSADDRYFAFSGLERQASIGYPDLRVDTKTGAVDAPAAEGGQLAGFSGDQFVTWDDNSPGKATVTVGTKSVALLPSQPLTKGILNGNGLVSSNGRQFVVISGGEDHVQTVTRFDLLTGKQIGNQIAVPPSTTDSAPTASAHVVYVTYSGLAVISVAPDGGTSVATQIAPSVHATGAFWASDAFDGGARRPLLLDRVSAWLLHWWAWGVFGALPLILTALAFVRRARRRKPTVLRFGFDESAFEHHWSRRRKVTTWSCLTLAVTTICTAVVVATVSRATVPSLVVRQPAILWSAADAAQANNGAIDGLPATVITQTIGEHGVAVLVENDSPRQLSVTGAQTQRSNWNHNNNVEIATTAASTGEVRSLRFSATATIPPHSSRWVRNLWSDTCLPGPDFGGYGVALGIALEVRAAGASRTETVPVTPNLRIDAPKPVPAGAKVCVEDPGPVASLAPIVATDSPLP